MTEPRYYDWDKTLSYDARIYMVVGAKGIGKTYGLRKKLLAWQDRRGERFLEAFRTQSERKDGMDEWAAKLLSGGDAPRGWEYETRSRRLVRYRVDEDGNRVKKRDKGDTCGYFVALSELQNAKRGTYDAGTRNVLMDEAIIDRRLDGTRRYKPYEWETLAKVIDSVLREQQGDERRTRLFLLANAVDLVNPYFQAAGIYKVPEFGYSWHLGKRMLLHYVPSDGSYASVTDTSLSSIMMSAVDSERMGIDAEFRDGRNVYVLDHKPRRVRYLFGMVFQGVRFGVWETYDGFAYVDNDMVEGVRAYALTGEDGAPNLLQARRSTGALRMMGELYYMGQVRYSTEATRRTFLRALASFGVR